jgi:hypothetical protein
MEVTGQMPPPWTWHIFQIIMDWFSHVYVLNHGVKWWITFTIAMSLKSREEVEIPSFLNNGGWFGCCYES